MNHEDTPAIRRVWTATETGTETPGGIFDIETRDGRDYRKCVQPGLPLHESLTEIMNRDSHRERDDRNRDRESRSRFMVPSGTGRPRMSVQAAGALISTCYRAALERLARH